ncbi:transcriptional regulator with XRE-family HTH domain [Sedimentibacter acidaminivorans]|uniref:Transcriptional regulator with XRE-family HTH domain n=1 Tax=Sedimentibacter acidaminivorans TaxID=913099 RepID=A0ABS4GAB8_9FIRM|nr:helix-turn-helix transcriptional regulator [Sedimentibacter acidaminivorans]MBP1924635.1 transcriptional regulator with XRE-family HTH domain [Sedimentibacter acidaminivorans]
MAFRDQIKKIMEVRNLKQVEFATLIKVDQSYISKILSKKQDFVPSDRLIDDICTTFKVREEWLRTGEGEMVADLGDKRSELISNLLGTKDEFLINMFSGIARMTVEEREILKKAAKIIKESNIF